MVLAAKSMSLYSSFLFSKNWNNPPKILIFTNVNTSLPQENIKIYDDVFVQIKNGILKGVFGFGSIVLVVICYNSFSNKTVELFDPFKYIWAWKQGHILNLLVKSRNKLWTPILAFLPLNASTCTCPSVSASVQYLLQRHNWKKLFKSFFFCKFVRKGFN